MLNDNSPHVIIAGNLSDGFKVYGTYETWDDACEAADGSETWIMPLESDVDQVDINGNFVALFGNLETGFTAVGTLTSIDDILDIEDAPSEEWLAFKLRSPEDAEKEL